MLKFAVVVVSVVLFACAVSVTAFDLPSDWNSYISGCSNSPPTILVRDASDRNSDLTNRDKRTTRDIQAAKDTNIALLNASPITIPIAPIAPIAPPPTVTAPITPPPITHNPLGSVQIPPPRYCTQGNGGTPNFFSADFEISVLNLESLFTCNIFDIEPTVETTFQYDDSAPWNQQWDTSVPFKVSGKNSTLPNDVFVQLPQIAIDKIFDDLINDDMISSASNLTQFQHLANVSSYFDPLTNLTTTHYFFNTSRQLQLMYSQDILVGGKNGSVVLPSSEPQHGRTLGNTTTVTLQVSVQPQTHPSGGIVLNGLFGLLFSETSFYTNEGTHVEPDGTVVHVAPTVYANAHAMPIAVGVSFGAASLVVVVIVALKVAAVGPFAMPPMPKAASP